MNFGYSYAKNKFIRSFCSILNKYTLISKELNLVGFSQSHRSGLERIIPDLPDKEPCPLFDLTPAFGPEGTRRRRKTAKRH